jgi:hypothetical protein
MADAQFLSCNSQAELRVLLEKFDPLRVGLREGPVMKAKVAQLPIAEPKHPTAQLTAVALKFKLFPAKGTLSMFGEKKWSTHL